MAAGGIGDLSLKQFIATYKLPQFAKVTQGYCADNDDDDEDLSTNDVIKVSRRRVVSFDRPQARRAYNLRLKQAEKL